MTLDFIVSFESTHQKKTNKKNRRSKALSVPKIWSFIVFDDDVTPGKKTSSLYKYPITPQNEHTITFEGITMRECNFVVRTRYVCSFDFWWWVFLSLNTASLL